MSAVDAPARRWFGDPTPLPGWRGHRLERADGPALFAAERPGNGPALLLIPGVCDPWHTFEPLFALLPDVPLWCIDLRGHGWSDRDSEGRYRVRDYVDDTIALVDALLPGRFAIAGNSLGALITAGVAAARPDRVDHVVLEDGPFLITEPAVWAGRKLRSAVFGDIAARLRQREDEGLSNDQFAALYADRAFAFMPDGELPSRIRWANKFLILLGGLRDSLDDAGRARMDAAVLSLVGGGGARWGDLFPAGMINEIAAKYAFVDWRVPATTADPSFSESFDHRAALGAIRAPTLVIEADRDLSGLLSTDEIAQIMAALGDRGQHLLVEGSLHEVHQTHPEIVTAALREHLGR